MLFQRIKKIKYEILIFVLFILMRLPDLGFDTFNTDVWKWKQRIYDFGSGVFTGNFEMTIQKYHPGVTLMWIGTVAVKFFNAYYEITTGSLPTDNNIRFVFELNFLQKILIVMTLGFVVSVIFWITKKVLSTRIAFLIFALVTLEPFYIALSREIHLEALMTTFMIASFVFLFAHISNLITVSEGLPKKAFPKFLVRYKFLLFSAIFAGLSVLTKTSALFLLPFTGLVLFFEHFASSKNFKNSLVGSLKIYGEWLLGFILTFVLFWPAMWIVPHKAVAELANGVLGTGIEEGHIQFYFGKLVTDPGMFYYFVVLWIKSSIYLLIGILALPFVFKKLSTQHKKFVVYSFSFAILYLIEMTIPSKKLDRYILPAMSALGLSFAIVFNHLYERVLALAKIQKIKSTTIKQSLVMALFLFPAIVTVVYIHPNYFSYYSPFSGGLSKGMFIVEPKWLFGQKELTQALDKIKDEDNLKGFEGTSLQKLYYKSILKEKLVVAFSIQDFSQLYPFVYSLDGWPTIDTLREDARQSNYFVYPVWDETSPAFAKYNLQYRSSVYLRGVKIYNIYTRGETK